MSDFPTGTVTFLFTDIEGSTTLAQRFPAELPALLARHHAILQHAIQAHQGRVFQIIGDAFCAAFYTASDALKTALDAQRSLQQEVWHPAPLKVRMGLHTGSAQAGVSEERAGGYAGYLTMTRVQRVMSIAHGGQVLLSNPTAELVRSELPAGVSLRDMGEHRLKGLTNLEHLWQLVAPGLQQEFPPLQSLHTIPDNLLIAGTTLHSRYHVDAELGRGGMGTVYRAQDTLLDRPVAIKVLGSSALGSEGRARLLREARAVAKLNHPNIMTVFDAGEVQGVPFIVMELITGLSLREYQPASLAEVIELTRQVCLALEHAHANDIIHRDLKPENVMLLPAPAQGDGLGVKVKLMDFGLAFTSGATRLTQEGAVIGTATYLAPELIERKSATPASDLYALGVMLYELTAHQPPFAGDTLIAVLSQHLYAPIVPPSTFNAEIPPALDALIVRLLNKRPEDRPVSAAEVHQALEHMTGGGSSTAAPSVAEPLSMLDRIVRGKLVGREHDLNEANAVWQRAASGQGQVLLISGEPGIGKTRLVRELMAQAHFSGADVLLGECYAEGSAPYAPIAQVIQSALDLAGFSRQSSSGGGDAGNLPGLSTAILADLITIVPGLRANYPDVPPNPPAEPQAEQQRLYDSVLRFISALATRAPVMLIIDDAHWADSATLSLLRHLARRMAKAQPAAPLRLLIILTYREVELDEARSFHEVLLDLNRERLETRLKLTRLSKDQTRDLLAAMFREEITPEFLNGIYRETEGNPFFTEEVCKALIESGKLRREGGRWQRPGMDEMQIPQSVRLAIQTRVSKLPKAAQDTLHVAAVIGREFEFVILQAMSDLNEDALIEALEMAQHAQLIAEVPRASRTAPLSFAFVHALIPSTLHEGLSSPRRLRLHRRAAQVLESVYAGRLDDFAPQIGRHYGEAGDSEKAIEYLLKAGDQARSVYAYEEAIEYYQQALAFLQEAGPAELARAARTAMNLATLQHTLLDFERSRAAYQAAFELWNRANSAPSQAQHLPASTPHTLRLHWPDVETLDPAWTNDTWHYALFNQLFVGLIKLSPELDIAPAVARSWETSPDGREIVFRLRHDMHWSDGHPVTARDFECAWTRTLNPASRSPNAQCLFSIKGARAYYEGRAPKRDAVGIQVMDDTTLRVALEEPVGHFLFLLAYAGLPIPQHVYETWAEAWSAPEHIATNGPFLLEDWEPGRSLRLRRNPVYVGRATGNVSRVELDLVLSEDADRSLDRYETDQHDIAWLTTPERRIEATRRRPPVEYLIQPPAGTSYFGFDTTRPPFDDARVRQAFAHALDRPSLASGLLRGTDMAATGGGVPPGLPGHSPGIGLAYNLDKARRLLFEAGYPDGRGFPKIEAWNSIWGYRLHTGRYAQRQWRELLGIEFEWEEMDWNTYLRRLNASPPQLFQMGWTPAFPDPVDFLDLAMHMPCHRWRNANYEQLLEAARRMPDLTERLKFYRAADRLLVEEASIIPLTYFGLHLLKKPWVRQYPVSSVQGAYFADVIMEDY